MYTKTNRSWLKRNVCTWLDHITLKLNMLYVNEIKGRLKTGQCEHLLSSRGTFHLLNYWEIYSHKHPTKWMVRRGYNRNLNNALFLLRIPSALGDWIKNNIKSGLSYKCQLAVATIVQSVLFEKIMIQFGSILFDGHFAFPVVESQSEKHIIWLDKRVIIMSRGQDVFSISI